MHNATLSALPVEAPAATKTGRLVVIDALRGIAVVMVILTHLPFSARTVIQHAVDSDESAGIPQALAPYLEFGRLGVHLFLVLSGFCIHLGWARRKDLLARIGFFAFWRRRMIRLYPPYIATVGLCVLGLYLAFRGAPTLAGHFGYDSMKQLGADVAIHLGLLQNLNSASFRLGNPPFWTLALEEQLYLLYFPLLLLRRRLGWPRTLAIVAVITMSFRAVGVVLQADGFVLPIRWFWFGMSRWIEWALGALAVEAYLGMVVLPRWTRSPWLTGVALVAAFAAAAFDSVPVVRVFSDATIGLAFFMLLNCFWQHEQRGGSLSAAPLRALAGVGLFSYSVYLTHTPVLVLAKQIGIRLGLSIDDRIDVFSMLVLRFGAALAGGYVFYRLVETYFIQLSRNRAS